MMHWVTEITEIQYTGHGLTSWIAIEKEEWGIAIALSLGSYEVWHL